MAYITDWNPPMLYQRTAQFEWDVDYAALVHEGAITDSYIYPARPWTDRAVAEIDAEVEFNAAYKDTKSLQEAFDSFVQTFDGEFKIAMADDIWNWPRITERSDGSTVSSPRNIIDTQALYDSQHYVMTHQGVSSDG